MDSSDSVVRWASDCCATSSVSASGETSGVGTTSVSVGVLGERVSREASPPDPQDDAITKRATRTKCRAAKHLETRLGFGFRESDQPNLNLPPAGKNGG